MEMRQNTLVAWKVKKDVYLGIVEAVGVGRCRVKLLYPYGNQEHWLAKSRLTALCQLDFGYDITSSVLPKIMLALAQENDELKKEIQVLKEKREIGICF